MKILTKSDEIKITHFRSVNLKRIQERQWFTTIYIGIVGGLLALVMKSKPDPFVVRTSILFVTIITIFLGIIIAKLNQEIRKYQDRIEEILGFCEPKYHWLSLKRWFSISRIFSTFYALSLCYLLIGGFFADVFLNCCQRDTLIRFPWFLLLMVPLCIAIILPLVGLLFNKPKNGAS